jgi:hypothetical protein
MATEGGEVTRKPNRAERILNFLEARYPGWVPAIELEPVGGRQGWRTAVAEARAIVKGDGHDIENRCRRVRRPLAGRTDPFWTLSEYRLKKHQESEATKDERSLAPACALPHSDGQDLREVRTDEASHNLNEWGLR